MQKRTFTFIALSVVLIVASCGVSIAESQKVFPNQPWPQYGNISPLPGGGIALDSSGSADGLGAFQINIPVAYTPGQGFMNLSAYAGNYCNGLSQPFGNGSGVFGMGFGNTTRVYMSGMQVSHVLKEAKALSGQVLLFPETSGRPAISFGTQDILFKEPHGRSYYGVATKKLSMSGKTIYASVGYGDGRFLFKPFAGVSLPIGEKYNFATEWDGFQINGGVTFRPGGRYGRYTFLGGYNGQSGWLAGVGSVFNYGPKN